MTPSSVECKLGKAIQARPDDRKDSHLVKQIGACHH